MSKAVKTIVKIASVAAAVYGGYAALGAAAQAGSAASGGITLGTETAASLGKGISLAAAPTGGPGITLAPTALGGAASASNTVGSSLIAGAKGLMSSKAMNIGGFAMQGLGQIQGKLAAQEAADQERRMERQQGQIQEAEAKRQMIAQQRQARIQAGQMEARAANVGVSPGGTSSVVTGQGSLNTQLNTNVADITGRLQASRNVGQTQTQINTALNQASGWKQFSDLGSNIFQNADRYGSIFNPIKVQLG